ncbi:hypothetical protein OH76DRAFT_943879 [Lentinus brumalis]|uniref:Uncharacterized protein n=1 Tax=Lentinus brumalis TaxID=2498619 RepID=A0A371CZ15_9APHY|nr:hypothetical protein OH76DRAFT_943879 [Polyporus brumalis]
MFVLFTLSRYLFARLLRHITLSLRGRLWRTGSAWTARCTLLFPHSSARCPLPVIGTTAPNTSLPSHGVVRPRPATLIVDVRPSERSEKEVWLARVALPRYSRNGRLGFTIILFASWSTPCASRRLCIAFSGLDCLRERQIRADGQACHRMQCWPLAAGQSNRVSAIVASWGVEWSRDVRRHEARKLVSDTNLSLLIRLCNMPRE